MGALWQICGLNLYVQIHLELMVVPRKVNMKRDRLSAGFLPIHPQTHHPPGHITTWHFRTSVVSSSKPFERLMLTASYLRFFPYF